MPVLLTILSDSCRSKINGLLLKFISRSSTRSRSRERIDDTLLHLGGSFTSESHSHHGFGPIYDAQQAKEALHQKTRFARTGRGFNYKGLAWLKRSFTLPKIEDQSSPSSEMAMVRIRHIGLILQ